MQTREETNTEPSLAEHATRRAARDVEHVERNTNPQRQRGCRVFVPPATVTGGYIAAKVREQLAGAAGRAAPKIVTEA
jgi:hypothetical protein